MNAAKPTPLQRYRHTAAALWGEQTAGSRGPKPALDAQRIAQAAIAIADSDGLAAVSMQRVATEFDFTTMSLYRYIPAKTALVNLMVDIALSTPPAAPEGDWRKRLSDWSHAALARFERHRWLLEAATAQRRLMGPNELAWMEAALAALDDTALSPFQRHEVFLLLLGHVRNTARRIEEADDPDGAWSTAVTELLRDHSHRFPHLLANTGAIGFGTGDETSFDYGLGCILDGIAARAAEAEQAR